MFKITANQMDAFRAGSLSEFELRLIKLLTSEFPDVEKVPLDQMRFFVREQMAQARRYGFVTEQDFGVYVMAAWVLGRDFDTAYAPPRLVLPSRGYGRNEKREWLIHWIYEIFAAGARAVNMGHKLVPLPD